MPICFPSAKKRTERRRLFELATTTSPAVLATHWFSAGLTHVSAGPATPVILTGRKDVFGMGSAAAEWGWWGGGRWGAGATARVGPWGGGAAAVGGGRRGVGVTGS